MPFLVGVLSPCMPEVRLNRLLSASATLHNVSSHYSSISALIAAAPQVLSLPIEDVLVLDVDDGRVTVAGAATLPPSRASSLVTFAAGEAVTLRHQLLQPLPGQVHDTPGFKTKIPLLCCSIGTAWPMPCMVC